MVLLNRRQFLYFAGSAIASCGLHQWDIVRHGERHGRVLARDTPRKIALLVGINQYPGGDELAGAATDVALQQQLLIHRFGFTPTDIHTLVDAQATRENILAAFEEYLIKQVRPGDVAVFHFSGHGSRVSDQPDCDEMALKLSQRCLHTSFVPVNNSLPLTNRVDGGTVLDITGHTLFLMMSAVQTEHMTVVLDCCHAGGGKRGNLRVRSLDGNAKLQVSPEELTYQNYWLSKLNLSPTEYRQRRRAGVAKGVVIASVGRDRLAADCPFDGFAAGAFTYAMTQYLWQQTQGEPIRSAIANIGRATAQLSYTGQVPEFETAPSNSDEQPPIYFLNQATPPAEAVITDVTHGNQINLWLGGINPDNFAAFDQGSVFSLLDARGKERGQVQLEPNSRNGLQAKATLLKGLANALQPGYFLQEVIRGIPRAGTLTLQIGLDASLGQAALQAEKQLQLLKQITVVPIQQNQAVHYILGRMTVELREQLQRTIPGLTSLPAVGSVGLFNAGSLGLLVDSFAVPDEPVVEAIARLQPKFKSLLALHLIKLILNPNSSGLKLSVAMTQVSNQAIIASKATRGTSQDTRNTTVNPGIQQLKLGTKTQLQITNHQTKDLYISVLAVDSNADISLLFPNAFNATATATVLRSGSTLKIPDRSRGDRFSLTVQNPLGLVEVLIIASTDPLSGALKALQAINTRGETGLGYEPMEVMETFLDDLQKTTRGTASEVPSTFQAARSIDTRRFAALSIGFEAVSD